MQVGKLPIYLSSYHSLAPRNHHPSSVLRWCHRVESLRPLLILLVTGFSPQALLSVEDKVQPVPRSKCAPARMRPGKLPIRLKPVFPENSNMSSEFSLGHVCIHLFFLDYVLLLNIQQLHPDAVKPACAVKVQKENKK